MKTSLRIVDFIRPLYRGGPSERPGRIASVVLSATEPLIGTDDPQTATKRLCQRLTTDLRSIELAWAWFGPADSNHIAPLVHAGRASEYAESLDIERTLLTKNGPAFRALRGERVHAYAVSSNSIYPPWRELANNHGIASAMVVPLARPEASHGGLLALYSNDGAFFSTENSELFWELGYLVGRSFETARRELLLRREANTDATTGVLNKRGLRAAIDELKENSRGAVMVVEIDHLRRLIELEGDVIAESALARVAHECERHTRTQGFVARLGDEQLVMVMPSLSTEEARERALNLSRALRGVTPDATLTLTIGIARFLDKMRFHEALAQATEALADARGMGRNRIMIAGEHLH